MSGTARAAELPTHKEPLYKKATQLEWLTIAFFFTAVVAVGITTGASQAMKAAWIEDLLAFVPPAAFLVASRKRYKEPDEENPYGHHRVVGIAFAASAAALLFLGLFVLYGSLTKLMAFEHPPIGLVQPFGSPVWAGWFMIAALAYTMVPGVILGRIKLPLANALHDKVLYADAQMNKADWMTAGAAILGIIGIYLGLWWMDGVAATFISVSIVSDGWHNMKAAVGTLMDKRPHLVDDSGVDPLPARLTTEVKKLSWVKDARVRMREEGHVFYGDVIVVPREGTDLPARIDEARKELMKLDWRLYDLVIMPSRTIEEPQDEATREESLS